MCEKQLRRGRGAQGQSIARGMRVNAGPLCSSSLHTAMRVGGRRQLRTSGLGGEAEAGTQSRPENGDVFAQHHYKLSPTVAAT